MPRWLKITLIITLTFSAYSFMLGAPFRVLDDQASIVTNPVIQNPARWAELFSQGYFGDQSYYRPLTNLSYMVEHALFGLNPFFFNLDNVILHVINAVLVWVLVGLLINVEVGFWVALLFAIHPIQWESVSNISGRAILLSTTFGLMSFIAYLKQWRWLALVWFVVALLCKESAAVLPIVFLMHAVLNKQKVSRLWPWAMVIGAYIVLRQYLGMTQIFPWRNASEYMLGFLTFLRSVLTDIRLLILPVDLHFDRSMKLLSSLSDPEALLTIFVWTTALCWLGIMRRKLNTVDWLALMWFALCLLPVSQIATSIGVGPGYISTAEHFLYMACIPVFMVVVPRILSIQILMVRVLSLGFFAFLLLTTVEQTMYAANDLAMMERSLKFQPHNARLQSSVGLVYAQKQKFPEAETHFRLAVAGDPSCALYQISLAKSICDQGRLKECLGLYDRIKDPQKLGPLLVNNRRAVLKLLEQQ